MKENLTSLAYNRGKRRFVRSINEKSIAVPDRLIKANQPEQDLDDKNRRFIEVKVNSRIAFDNEKIKSEMKNGGGARSSSERIIASLEEIATTTSEEEESKAAKKAKIDSKLKTHKSK